jgi:hypothetical protein
MHKITLTFVPFTEERLQKLVLLHSKRTFNKKLKVFRNKYLFVSKKFMVIQN